MPRKPNGSLWRAWTTASICESTGRRMSASALPRQNVEDALQRDRDPLRPVRQLVADLVHRLFELEECQHLARLALIRRIGGAAAHRPPVGGAQPVDGALAPGLGQLHHPGL